MNAALALGGVALGGIVAWLGSLHGANREAKREHARWLREHRFTAWTELLGIATQAAILSRDDVTPLPDEDTITTREELEELREELTAAFEAAKQVSALLDASSVVGATTEGLGPASFLPHTRSLWGAIRVTLAAEDEETVDVATDVLDEERVNFARALRAQLNAD